MQSSLSSSNTFRVGEIGVFATGYFTITGLVAKENVVGTMGILYSAGKVAENG